MNNRNYGIPSYSQPEGDDIRTIPDFYDNLYPTHEQTQSCITTAKRKVSNNPKTVRNIKKNVEN